MCGTEACERAECYRLVPRKAGSEVISAAGIDYRRITGYLTMSNPGGMLALLRWHDRPRSRESKR